MSKKSYFKENSQGWKGPKNTAVCICDYIDDCKSINHRTGGLFNGVSLSVGKRYKIIKEGVFYNDLLNTEDPMIIILDDRDVLVGVVSKNFDFSDCYMDNYSLSLKEKASEKEVSHHEPNLDFEESEEELENNDFDYNEDSDEEESEYDATDDDVEDEKFFDEEPAPNNFKSENVHKIENTGSIKPASLKHTKLIDDDVVFDNYLYGYRILKTSICNDLANSEYMTKLLSNETKLVFKSKISEHLYLCYLEDNQIKINNCSMNNTQNEASFFIGSHSPFHGDDLDHKFEAWLAYKEIV